MRKEPLPYVHVPERSALPELSKDSCRWAVIIRAAASCADTDGPQRSRAYLSLLTGSAVTEKIVTSLRKASTTQFPAKDILRASGLPLLDAPDAHVTSNLAKIVQGAAPSPLLLLRGDLARGIDTVVADGYHRLCASYYTDEDANVSVRILDLP